MSSLCEKRRRRNTEFLSAVTSYVCFFLCCIKCHSCSHVGVEADSISQIRKLRNIQDHLVKDRAAKQLNLDWPKIKSIIFILPPCYPQNTDCVALILSCLGQGSLLFHLGAFLSHSLDRSRNLVTRPDLFRLRNH